MDFVSNLLNFDLEKRFSVYYLYNLQNSLTRISTSVSQTLDISSIKEDEAEEDDNQGKSQDANSDLNKKIINLENFSEFTNNFQKMIKKTNFQSLFKKANQALI